MSENSGNVVLPSILLFRSDGVLGNELFGISVDRGGKDSAGGVSAVSFREINGIEPSTFSSSSPVLSATSSLSLILAVLVRDDEGLQEGRFVERSFNGEAAKACRLV